jgi:Uncharacterized conserved protein (DUF2190)
VAAPRDNDLAVYVTHRQTVTYASITTAGTGQPVDFNRALVVANNVPVFGVLEQDAVQGRDVSIAIQGICQGISGGAIAPGQAIGCDGTGRFVAVAAGAVCFGRALSTATAAGQKFQMLITREGTN